jgi:hypothetical protein
MSKNEKTPQQIFEEIEKEIRRTAAAGWREKPARDCEEGHERRARALWLCQVMGKARASYLGEDFVAIQLAEEGAAR